MRRRTDGPLWTAALATLAIGASGCESEPPAPAGPGGCYVLVDDPWADQRVPWTSRFAPPGDVPPRAFRLLALSPDSAAGDPTRSARSAPPAPTGFTVEALPGWPPLATAVTGARPIGDSLALWWTSGFKGVMLRLAPDSAAGLAGRAQAVDDHGRDSGSTPVLYRRVDCEDLDFTPLDWTCTRSWCEEYR